MPAPAVRSRRPQRPGRVLAVGLLLAVLGWVADTQTSVQSDVTKLVPSNMPALRDLHTLEHVTGVSGEIDVVVHARERRDAERDRLDDPLREHAARALRLRRDQGLRARRRCARRCRCPTCSRSGAQARRARRSLTHGCDQRRCSRAVPRYFSQAVITPDHREATLAFGIRLMPLSRQQQVIDYMRSQLHPPPGVTAQLAGLPVLAAQANAALSSSARRLLMLLAGLVAVGLVLLAVFRRPRARARAADPDRARDRLVGADPVR